MSALFVINPIAGKGRKEKLLEVLRRGGHRAVLTEYAGQAELIARDAAGDVVVAVGGDGTVNEVARGLLGSDKILGILPCGSGDGLARCLGIGHKLSEAIRIIENGKTAPLDAGFVNGRAFFSVCGVGFDANVSKMFALSGKRGLSTYIAKSVELWRTFKPERFTINIDGMEWTQEAVAVIVGNSNQWGNGAKITPEADCGDGLLDITVLDMFHSIEIPHLVTLLMSGHSNLSRRSHCYRGRQIRISRSSEGPAHFDGDWFDGVKQLDVSLQPSALRVLVP